MYTEISDIESLRDVSQIFSTSNFKSIARDNAIRYTSNKVRKHLNLKNANQASFESVIRYLYRELQQKYKNEYLFKNTLLNTLVLEKYSIETTTVLSEFKIGNSIADLVLLNGEIKIFEIKTDLDNLVKLNKQLIDYCQFANKVYVVASSKYSDKLLEEYRTSHIGIIELTNENSLREVKEAE